MIEPHTLSNRRHTAVAGSHRDTIMGDTAVVGPDRKSNGSHTSVFGPKRERVMGCWRKLYNEEINDLYYASNIINITMKRQESRRGMHTRLC